MSYRAGDHILKRAVLPVAMPITLAQAKAHLRVDHDAEDEQITSFILAATAMLDAQGELGLAICEQTWDESLQNPSRDVALSIIPARSIVSVSYFDAENVLQVADLSKFALYSGESWAFVRSDNWPAAFDRPDAITIRYVAGLDEVPADLGHAIRLIVADMYEHREDSSEAKLSEIPHSARNIVNNLRIGWYG